MEKYILAIGWGGNGNITIPIQFKIEGDKAIIDLNELESLNKEYDIVYDEEQKETYFSI